MSYIIPCLIGLFFVLCNKLSYKKSIIGIFISGIIARIIFLIKTTIYDYDFDLSTHLEYIKYIFDNNKIPTTKLIEQNYSFYHPPLFHIICAVWLKIRSLFTSNFNFEGLTPLLLIINLITLFFIYKIIIELIPNNKWALFVVTFIPPSIFFSHIINNDILLFMFVFIAIYYFIKWQKNYDTKYIIITGICCSLAMMTKYSIIILVAAFGLIGMYLIYKNNSKKAILLFKQFCIFLVIFATGFWYNIMNIINNVRPFLMLLPTESEDYRKADLSKIFEINIKQLTNPFMIKNLNPETNKHEINYLFYITRTFLFEGREYENLYWLCEIIFLLGTVLIIFGTVKLLLIKTNNLTINMFKIYVIMGYVLHIKYIIDSPFPCTFNARYIMPQLIITLFMLFYKQPKKYKITFKSPSITMLNKKSIFKF